VKSGKGTTTTDNRLTSYSTIDKTGDGHIILYFMRKAPTKSQQMALNSDTRDNFLLWYIQEFGFNPNAATTLYDVQMLKDAKTLSELDNDAVANICKAVSKDTSQSVAKIAATKLKLACFWIRHQYRTLREIGGTVRPLVKTLYSGTIDLLRQQK
jgi:hypothetical protein